jgi:hypothetical protein
MLASPMLAGGKRERERGGGESVSPPLHEGSGMLPSGEREEKRRRKIPYERERDWFQDLQGIPFIS